MASIRDYFHHSGDRERAIDIERDYLTVKDLRTQERVPRLQLNEIDNDFFSRRVLSSPDSLERHTEPAKPSHRRIAEAATLASNKVKELAQLTNRPTDYLVDWIEYLRTKVKVIWVAVPDYANAFTIFET